MRWDSAHETRMLRVEPGTDRRRVGDLGAVGAFGKIRRRDSPRYRSAPSGLPTARHQGFLVEPTAINGARTFPLSAAGAHSWQTPRRDE